MYSVIENTNRLPSTLFNIPEISDNTPFIHPRLMPETIIPNDDVVLLNPTPPSKDKNGESKNKISKIDNSAPAVLRKERFTPNSNEKTRIRQIYEERVKYKFFCSHCSFKSKRDSHFRKHMALHESGDVEVHCCNECDFKTIRLSHLRRHELLHKSSLVK